MCLLAKYIYFVLGKQGGEDDLDALLANFQLQDQAKTRIELIEDGPPTARVHASWVPTNSQVYMRDPIYFLLHHCPMLLAVLWPTHCRYH